jgi:hypothetical protein
MAGAVGEVEPRWSGSWLGNRNNEQRPGARSQQVLKKSIPEKGL